MSIRIIREVFAYAPSDLKAAELVTLIALAEDARDDRIARYSSHDKLLARTRLGRSRLYEAVAHLEAAGLIRRIGTAHRGRVQHYRIAQLHAHHQAATIHYLHPDTPDHPHTGKGPAYGTQ